MQYSKVAGGDILPSRFVTMVGETDGVVVAAGADAQTFGVSQPGTRNTPYSTLDDGKAAVAGENVMIHGPGENVGVDVMLELGGTVVPGTRIKSGVAGVGLAEAAAGDFIGAVALADGVIGQLIPVQIVGPFERHAV